MAGFLTTHVLRYRARAARRRAGDCAVSAWDGDRTRGIGAHDHQRGWAHRQPVSAKGTVRQRAGNELVLPPAGGLSARTGQAGDAPLFLDEVRSASGSATLTAITMCRFCPIAFRVFPPYRGSLRPPRAKRRLTPCERQRAIGLAARQEQAWQIRLVIYSTCTGANSGRNGLCWMRNSVQGMERHVAEWPGPVSVVLAYTNLPLPFGVHCPPGSLGLWTWLSFRAVASILPHLGRRRGTVGGRRRMTMRRSISRQRCADRGAKTWSSGLEYTLGTRAAAFFDGSQRSSRWRRRAVRALGR